MNILYFSSLISENCHQSIHLIDHTINNTNVAILTKREVTINSFKPLNPYILNYHPWKHTWLERLPWDLSWKPVFTTCPHYKNRSTCRRRKYNRIYKPSNYVIQSASTSGSCWLNLNRKDTILGVKHHVPDCILYSRAEPDNLNNNYRPTLPFLLWISQLLPRQSLKIVKTAWLQNIFTDLLNRILIFQISNDFILPEVHPCS